MSRIGTFAPFAALLLAVILAGCHARVDPSVINDQISLSILHGDYNPASAAADQAIKQFGSDAQWLWRFRISKARILVFQSNYNDALAILHEDLPSTLANSDIAVRRSMVLGMAHRVAQNFNKAQEELAYAQALAAQFQPQVMCEVLNAKGALEGQLGENSEAEKTYKEALELARKYNRPDQEAVARVGLAWVASNLEHFDEAVDRGLEALELSKSLGMLGFVATVDGNLGYSYSQLGNFETSLDYYQQAADLSRQVGLPGYSLYWLTGVANDFEALHKYEFAETLSKQTLDLARKIKSAQTVAECLNDLSRFALLKGDLEQAQQYNREVLALESAGADRFGLLDATYLSGRIAERRKQFSEAKAAFDRMIGDPKTDSQQRWESLAALGDLGNQQEQPAIAEEQYLKAIDTIELARRSIGHDELRLSFLSSGIAVYGDYIDFLVRRGRDEDALKEAELSRARTLEEGLRGGAQAEKLALKTFRPGQIAERLNATLLFYWLGEKQSHLWVIEPRQTVHLDLPGAEQIDPLVKSYREALQSTRDPLATANPEGQKLYSMLIEPARKLIPAHSRVIVLPDDRLYDLNFETLIVPDPKPHYWIEDVTLSTGSSLTLLASAAANRAPKEKSLFLVGDTVPPNNAFPKLTQAADEMKNIEKHFQESRERILSGSQATPSAYLQNKPEQYSYLHFVTHGTASRARPLESAVILSQEKDEDSYKLYARDIVKRRLSAYLVTISACNTSGTRTFSGEGLIGLSWAFQRAGAHNVIGALWEVSDTATPQLMDTLYNGLSHGDDPATALRAAKLSLLHSDSVFRKSRYWAPFQLYVGS